MSDKPIMAHMTYRNRRYAGYTHDEALAYDGNIYYRTKIVLDNGEWYPNIEELAKAKGVAVKAVRYRLDMGDSYDDAIRHAGRTPVVGDLVIDGVPYPSLLEVARVFSVNPSTLRSRVLNGWTPEQAVGRTPPPNVRQYVVDGVPWTSIKTLAGAYDMKPERVRRRIAKHWTPTEAVGVDPEPTKDELARRADAAT